MELDIKFGYSGEGRSNALELIKKAITEEVERKQREALLQSLEVDDKAYETNQVNMYQSLVNIINEGVGFNESLLNLNEAVETLSDDISIEQLKKQIKYSKNPLEVKMLNKKLN